MGCAAGLHACIERWNILEAPTTYIANFLDKHPVAYKVSLIVMHLFRAAMMVGFMFIPSMPFIPGMAVCFVGSLLYRLTVERNCAYKFALPAFAGAAAFMLALPAFISMINGTAFTSVALGFGNVASLSPLALYGAYVILTVSYDVDRTLSKKDGKTPCCSSTTNPNQHT